MSEWRTHLFQPIKLGRVELKNRVAMAPMGLAGQMNADGSPGPRAIDYYMERVRGGVGLIITHACRTEDDIDPSRQGLGFPVLTHTSSGPLTELSEVAHAFGSRLFVQLSAGFGRVAHPHILRDKPVSASAIPNYWDPELTCRELTTDEVEGMVKAFGRVAEMLGASGVDGIELHGHEGYLFDQFTTAFWNRRTDKYGGDLKARLRFPLEVLSEIKKVLGPGFPVQYRFGLKHYMKDLQSGALAGEAYQEAGRDVEEGLQMARLLEEAGFDALHVDAGCYDSWYWAHPPGYQEHGCMIDMAEQVKKIVKIPIIAVGRLDIPEIAGRAIADGKADIVAIGRGLLADPFWVKKVEQGRENHIRPCIGCHEGCMARLVIGKPTSCAVNSATGREQAYALQIALRAKRVAVIGGGVAGMEAARVAASRGHRVVLYERSDKLGGHVTEAAVMPFKTDELRLVQWYEAELQELKVEVRLKTEITSAWADRNDAEVVIVATGSRPAHLKVPGAEAGGVMTACDLLSGKSVVASSVAVVGGGQVGCEIALWLSQQGKKVTIIERLDDILIAGRPLPWMNRKMLLDLLTFHKVDVRFQTSILEVKKDEVVLIDRNFRVENLSAGAVIMATGFEPEQGLYLSLRGRRPDLYLIGDAREPKNIMNAIWDAYEVARAI
jgi:2-enoate reductase